MKKTLFIIFTLTFLVFAMSGLAPVYANGHGGHGHISGGIWIGPGWWGPWWGGPWWGWGPGYPYPYYQSSPVVIQQQSPIYEDEAPQQEQQQYYWYFCPRAKNYYPYVKQCPEGWMKVVPPPQTPPK